MDVIAFLKSTNAEFSLLQDRVRHLIEERHFPTDGEWKESILRGVLRRHATTELTVGRGFLVGSGFISAQIDVLIRHSHRPVFHQDADLVVAPLDAAAATVEVKTTYKKRDVAKALDDLIAVSAFRANNMPVDGRAFPFTSGLFVFAKPRRGQIAELLAVMVEKSQGWWARTIDHVAFGPDTYIRIERDRQPDNSWGPSYYRAYETTGIARAVFAIMLLYDLQPDSQTYDWPRWLPSPPDLGRKVAEAMIVRRPVEEPATTLPAAQRV